MDVESSLVLEGSNASGPNVGNSDFDEEVELSYDGSEEGPRVPPPDSVVGQDSLDDEPEPDGSRDEECARSGPTSWDPSITVAEQASYGWFSHQKVRAGADFGKHFRRLSDKHPKCADGSSSLAMLLSDAFMLL